MCKGMIVITVLVSLLGAAYPGAAQTVPALPQESAPLASSVENSVPSEAPARHPEPPERAVFAFALEPSAKQATSIVRTVGIAGGMALAGWGISTILDGVTNGAGSSLVHRGIAMSAAGSLIVSVFAAFMDEEAR